MLSHLPNKSANTSKWVTNCFTKNMDQFNGCKLFKIKLANKIYHILDKNKIFEHLRSDMQ